MRPIVVMSLGLILALPSAAGAQPLPQDAGAGAVPGQPQDAASRRRAEQNAMAAETRGALLAPGAPPQAGGIAPPAQRPPRSEKAIGPDLAAYIFAPIGGIVGPITEGLHAFDAAIAPINEALQPITGPYGAALVVGPDGAPLAPEATAAAAEPAAAEPPRSARGPRK